MRPTISNRPLLVLAVLVALMATAFTAWLRISVFFDPDGLNYYKEGKSDAIADLRNGRLAIKDDQTDTLKERIYKEDLQKEHAIRRDALIVDRIPVQLADYIRGYNEVMALAIRDHLGRAKLDRLERQVGDEVEQRTQTGEYDIYSAVLSEIEQDLAMVLVLGDKTWDRLSNLEPEFRSKFELRKMVEDSNTPEPLSSSRVDAIEDYEAKNSTPVLLKQRLEIKSKCLLLSESALATLFTGSNYSRDAWKKYYKKYPHSHGYIRLSRVGFNRQMTEALIYVERECGSLCADGRFKLLVKEGDRWTIKNSIRFYAS
jgi:hypothetical protein